MTAAPKNPGVPFHIQPAILGPPRVHYDLIQKHRVWHISKPRWPIWIKQAMRCCLLWACAPGAARLVFLLLFLVVVACKIKSTPSPTGLTCTGVGQKLMEKGGWVWWAWTWERFQNPWSWVVGEIRFYIPLKGNRNSNLNRVLQWFVLTWHRDSNLTR